MNKKVVFYMLGRIITLQAALMLLPLICGLIYRETSSAVSFSITIVIAAATGLILTHLVKPESKSIFAREGFSIVALAWISMSAIGALPFVISGEIPSFTDAFFETVSGFTTTGASIVRNVEAMPHCILFWRSFTHWIGGMGVLVLVMAIIPTDTGGSIHIIRAEMPGPIVGKLVPKIRTTAKILYIIYIAMTMAEIALLLFGGMPLFESIVHSFGTAGTGGFGIKADSIAGYSAYNQWVITVFMILFGVNFNIYYLLLMRKFRSAVKSEEIWVYFTVIFAAISTITFDIYPMYKNIFVSIRHSAFQVASIISTTGYVTADYNLWPTLSKTVLLLLMFIGACAGSTGGGFKISRLILVYKQIKANLKNMLHSRSISSIRFEGRFVDNSTIVNTTTYFALYSLCYVLIFMLISIADNFDIETNISAAAACFNNIGPGLSAVGPASSYAAYSGFSKWALSASMLMGRLEILPMILLFTPNSWIKIKKIKKIRV